MKHPHRHCWPNRWKLPGSHGHRASTPPPTGKRQHRTICRATAHRYGETGDRWAGTEGDAPAGGSGCRAGGRRQQMGPDPEPEDPRDGTMMLKTIQQWDICSQEDLETFRKESEAIHQSVARTLYQTDPYANPSEEPDESTSEAELVSAAYPGREEFLKRLSRHLAQRVNPGTDGYTITVKATVDCRHGKAVRAEFVEAEGPRLADLPNPNADRGMYFILRLTQLIVRPDSRLSVLRYKIAPKCLLSGPFGHSGVGGNPGVAGPVRSYNLVFTYPYQQPQRGPRPGGADTPRGGREALPDRRPVRKHQGRREPRR